jgi:hypothetical protein
MATGALYRAKMVRVLISCFIYCYKQACRSQFSHNSLGFGTCLVCSDWFDITQLYVLPTQRYFCVSCGSDNNQRFFPIQH